MFKKIIILSIALLVLFTLVAKKRYKREKDLSDDPRWSHLVEMELIPKESLLLFFSEETKCIYVILFGHFDPIPKNLDEYYQLKEAKILDQTTKEYGKCLGLLNEKIKIVKIVETYNNMFGATPDMRAEILSGEFKGNIVSLNFVSQGSRLGTTFFPYERCFSVTDKPRKKPESLNEDAFSVNPYAKAMEKLGDQYVSEYLDNSENEQEK